jgi:hypothetical protein
MRLAASTVALVAVLAASPAWAGATAKHSGRIITADPAHQTLTVEGGPVAWLGGHGDFVTATMDRQGGRTIATKVTVVRPKGSQDLAPQAR